VGSRVSSRRIWPVAAWMMRIWWSWTRSRTEVPAKVLPIPLWWRRPAVRRVTLPPLKIRSVRTRSCTQDRAT